MALMLMRANSGQNDRYWAILPPVKIDIAVAFHRVLSASLRSPKKNQFFCVRDGVAYGAWHPGVKMDSQDG